MVKKYRRKGYRKKGRKHYKRRKSGVRKALSMARSLTRKMAGEVKKLDVNAIIPESDFVAITSPLGTAADNPVSLPDFSYVYDVFGGSGAAQGIQLGDFVGEQIKAKYLYLGLHVQMPVRPSDTASTALTVQQPLCLRCMVVQDRNYSSVLSNTQMIANLFGTLTTTSGETAYTYLNQADYTLLPINPQEPGRFNVIRDFKMYVAPGYRMDYYKKIMLLQRNLLSGGKFYAGAAQSATNQAPGQGLSNWTSMRNRIYIVLLYQSPTLYGVNTGGSPDFTVSVQTRLAYYDN